MKHLIALCFNLLFCLFVFGQQKFEKESRIPQDEVPNQALKYIQSLFSDSPKVQWYREESLDRIAVEGKIKRQDGVYSIKFNTDGLLHDVELTRNLSQLPDRVQVSIESYISRNYDRYRIKKVQVQWVGDPAIIRSLVRRERHSDDYTTNYEIEFSGRKDRRTKPYEALFDDHGEHVETKEIIPRNLSHLLY